MLGSCKNDDTSEEASDIFTQRNLLFLSNLKIPFDNVTFIFLFFNGFSVGFASVATFKQSCNPEATKELHVPSDVLQVTFINYRL